MPLSSFCSIIIERAEAREDPKKQIDRFFCEMELRRATAALAQVRDRFALHPKRRFPAPASDAAALRQLMREVEELLAAAEEAAPPLPPQQRPQLSQLESLPLEVQVRCGLWLDADSFDMLERCCTNLQSVVGPMVLEQAHAAFKQEAPLRRGEVKMVAIAPQVGRSYPARTKLESVRAAQLYPAAGAAGAVDGELVELERLGLAFSTDILKHDPDGFCVNVAWAPPHIILHMHRALSDGKPASLLFRNVARLGDALVGINGVWVGSSPESFDDQDCAAANPFDVDRDRAEAHFNWVVKHLAAVPHGVECKFHFVRSAHKGKLKLLLERQHKQELLCNNGAGNRGSLRLARPQTWGDVAARAHRRFMASQDSDPRPCPPPSQLDV